jgi:hypothetical protein
VNYKKNVKKIKGEAGTTVIFQQNECLRCTANTIKKDCNKFLGISFFKKKSFFI